MTDGKGFYSLPALPYGYGELAPFISEQLLKVHHDGHHQKYVNQANGLLEKMDKARAEGTMPNMKAEAQALAFNVGGHFLHKLYWENMRPATSGGGGRPGGKIADLLDQEFGGFERFQKEFTELANTVESSGWATLIYCSMTKRPLLVQVKDHDLYAIPGFKVLMVMDVWEHAYYLDYKNEKAKYTANFWNVINWDVIDQRLEKVLGGRKEGMAVPVAAAGGSL
ncbi:MAG: superoxide dismutase [Methanomassiliicoccus sp.]|nr:superoxide dismutase [Methanomassiliicoccus sp.]